MAMAYSSFPTRLFPITVDVLPTSPAFLCASIEDYHNAVRVYSNKWTQRRNLYGKWNDWATKSFHNWVVALMKIKKFEEAEGICRKRLQELEEESLHESDDYYSTQCNLATCIALSRRYEEAGALFRRIRQRDDILSRYPARSFYEVLCLTYVTQKDCSVLRDSSDGFEEYLVEINDYVGQLDRPSTSAAIRLGASLVSSTDKSNQLNSLGKKWWYMRESLLLKMGNLPRRFSRLERASKKPSSTDLERPTIVGNGGMNLQQAQPALHSPTEVSPTMLESKSIQQWETSSHWLGLRECLKPAQNTVSEEQPIHEPQPTSPMHANMPFDPLQPVQPTGKVESWLSGLRTSAEEVRFSGPPPLPQRMIATEATNTSMFAAPSGLCPPSPPSAEAVNTDVAPGLTERSDRTNQTMRSSQFADAERLNAATKLQVKARNGDKCNELFAFLDAGSEANCVSELLCKFLGVYIDPSPSTPLVTANNQEMEVLGKAKIDISWDGVSPTRSARLCFYIVKDLCCDMLLGWQCINQWKLCEGSAALVAAIRKRRPTDMVSIDIRADNVATPVHNEGISSLEPIPDDKTSTVTGHSNESLIGGSDTTAPSRTSSLTGTIVSHTLTRSTTSHSLSRSIFSQMEG